MPDEYKYDVAISFVARDEPLATELNALLKSRLKTFLYSERQRDVAGTDGEKVFGAVFNKESRVVVVLYRKEWGTTAWTRIEETAIRNRAFDEGYDFVLFIPLDSPPSVPKWLPKNRIYIGLDRWGVKGAAAVIEARIQDQGGDVKEVTPSDRALELARRLAIEKKNKALLNSEEGVKLAQAEVETLLGALEKVSSDTAADPGVAKIGFKKQGRAARVQAGGHSLCFYWSNFYCNTLNNSRLHVTVWNGFVPLDGERAFPVERTPLLESDWAFDLSPEGKAQWKSADSEKLLTTDELIHYFLEELFKSIDEAARNSADT